jgi:hypothetical protein
MVTLSRPGASLEPNTAGPNRLTPMSTVQTKGAAVIPMRDANQVLGKEVFGHDQELVIEPGRSERHYWRDLWQYRELFQILAWRDISVRYKQPRSAATIWQPQALVRIG